MKLRKAEFSLILKTGESYHVEFKAGFNKSFAREVTAFANASGGRIFLGVTDTGNPIGITITNALKSRIQDTARNCQPPVDISIEQIDDILIVTVPEGKNKPYQCSDGFFIRMGGNAQKMDRDRIIEFIQNEGHVRFEEQQHRKFEFKRDFSPVKLQAYLNLAGITATLDDESILVNLGVAEKAADTLCMNNAGVLFFTESIQLLCEQATITCGVFDGTERVHVLNRKDYTMDIISNIENGLHFIKQELRVRYEMTGTARRKEVYELPLDALREAVINAVIHRDYLQTGSHTVVEIFDDRIEISNPGGLPKGLSPAEFGKKAVRRNPLIASLLHRVDFVENMGTGINKIRTLLKTANAPEAVFEFGSFYTVRFPRPAKDGEINRGSGIDAHGEQVREPERRLLSAIMQNPSASQEHYAAQLGCSRATIARMVQNLKDGGMLKRTGPPKGGHWEIVPTNDTENDTENETVNDTLNALLDALRKDPELSMDELAKLLGKSRATVARNIKKLREMDSVRRVGGDRVGRWEIIS